MLIFVKSFKEAYPLGFFALLLKSARHCLQQK
nr:MAG TPA: hypothetical protein [Caudoviricetes sp.]